MNLYVLSGTHNTRKLCDLVAEQAQHVVCLLFLYHDRNDVGASCTLVALFREPNSLGQLTAFVNPGEAIADTAYTGAGPTAWEYLKQVIDETQVQRVDLEGDDLSANVQALLADKADWLHVQRWEAVLRDDLHAHYAERLMAMAQTGLLPRG